MLRMIISCKAVGFEHISEIKKQSFRGVLCKKMFLEISKNSQENTCGSLFFNKVAGLKPATLLKKRLWRRCFPVNFVKFLRTPFLQNTSERLLLEICKVEIKIEIKSLRT